VLRKVVSRRRADCFAKCCFFAMGLCLMFSACTRNREIEYIFPDGFRGGAVIRENRPTGIPVCRQSWFLRNERCTIKFPSSGIVEVQGQAPEGMWHYASARYENGTVIPTPYTTPGANFPSNTLALWSFGSIQNGEAWFFVGTEEEFRKFRDDHHRYKY
jgi:hypothetical protein